MTSVKTPDNNASPTVKLVGFSTLAAMAEADGGFLWLSGVDQTLAGLTPQDLEDCGVRFDSDASALSFCLNGRTFTAVEDANDGYRSALGYFIEREGEHCRNRFPSVPLLLRFYCGYEHPRAWRDDNDDWQARASITFEPGLLTLKAEEANAFELLDPSSPDSILCVGTDYSDDYYPCFVSYFSPERLTPALARFEARQVELASEGSAALAPASRHRL